MAPRHKLNRSDKGLIIVFVGLGAFALAFIGPLFGIHHPSILLGLLVGGTFTLFLGILEMGLALIRK